MRDGDDLLASHHHRKVVLDGVCNMRDLGGLPTTDGRITRRGVVYRSDTLMSLSDGDLSRLDTLAVRAIVDLRTTDEQRREPDRIPADSDISIYDAGFIPTGNLEMIEAVSQGRMTADQAHAAMLRQYCRLALEHIDRYREYLAVLLDRRTPLILHCASGKDRTGVAAAITLLAVDVPRRVVIEDYVVSNFQRRKVDLFDSDSPVGAVDKIMSADASYLEAAISAMSDHYGSVDGYLADGLGLTGSDRAELRKLLIE